MLTQSRVAGGLSIFLVAGLISFVFAPSARANAWNEKMLVTVSGPVEIPGRVLSAGTYAFKIVNSGAGKPVVGIFNAETGNFVTFAFANLAYRQEPSSHPVITLQERPSDTPPAIHEWFYPGDQWGMEFTYPHLGQTLRTALKHKGQLTKG